MIVDKIENFAKYSDLQPGIVKAIEYLNSKDFTRVENGRYELDGQNRVAIVMRYKTKLDENAVWESHRKYIDVQYIVSGHERFGYVHMSQAPAVTAGYSEEKDVILYAPGTKMYDAPARTVMIFYPEDIHAPSLAIGDPPTPADVVKVVVKVAMESK